MYPRVLNEMRFLPKAFPARVVIAYVGSSIEMYPFVLDQS